MLFLLHLIHDAGGAGVAQLAAALQQAGGGLPGVDDHVHGLLEHGVGACVLLGVGTAAALFAVLNGVLFHGLDHGLVVLHGGAGLIKSSTRLISSSRTKVPWIRVGLGAPTGIKSISP